MGTKDVISIGNISLIKTRNRHEVKAEES